jgi:hypothetical protein
MLGLGMCIGGRGLGIWCEDEVVGRECLLRMEQWIWRLAFRVLGSI